MFKSASHLTMNVICPSLVQEMHSLSGSAMTTAIMVVMIIVKMKYEKHHESTEYVRRPGKSFKTRSLHVFSAWQPSQKYAIQIWIYNVLFAHNNIVICKQMKCRYVTIWTPYCDSEYIRCKITSNHFLSALFKSHCLFKFIDTCM